MSVLKNILADKGYSRKKQSLGLDSPAMTMLHRERILQKKFLKKLYCDWYRDILNRISGNKIPNGKILEIGSGGGFIKEMRNDIITSDVLPLSHCNMVISAETIPFEENELAAIIMTDTFHHLPDCEKFLSEANRTLRAGGKIIMVEPANTLWSRFIYKNLHHEPFHAQTKSWTFPSAGPLSDSNIALPWIVFQRDYGLFRQKFPLLNLADISFHTPALYLISGGLPYKSPLPGWSYEIVKFAESLLSPLAKYLAMFQTIEIVKAHPSVSATGGLPNAMP